MLLGSPYPQGYYGLAPASTARPWKSEVVRAKGAATVNTLAMHVGGLPGKVPPTSKAQSGTAPKLYKLPYRKLLGKLIRGLRDWKRITCSRQQLTTEAG